MLSAPAWANPDLAQKKNCMACHAVAQKVIGPSYKEVAAKYAGQADAVAKLVPKVMKGGSGVWGAVPMPANPQVNEAEAKQLVAVDPHVEVMRAHHFDASLYRIAPSPLRSPPSAREGRTPSESL